MSETQMLYEDLERVQEPKGYLFNKDIICPCVYRGRDVEEYGSCYCNLYVSRAWNDEEIAHEYVPERRPLPESCNVFTKRRPEKLF